MIIPADGNIKVLMDALEPARFDVNHYFNVGRLLGMAIKERASQHDMAWIDVKYQDHTFTRDDYNDVMSDALFERWALVEEAFTMMHLREAFEEGVPACMQMLNECKKDVTHAYGDFMPMARGRVIDLYSMFHEYLEETVQSGIVRLAHEDVARLRVLGNAMYELFGEDTPRWNKTAHDLNCNRLLAEALTDDLREKMALLETAPSHKERVRQINEVVQMAEQLNGNPTLRGYPSVNQAVRDVRNFFNQQTTPPAAPKLRP